MQTGKATHTGKVLGTIDSKAILRPAILRTFVNKNVGRDGFVSAEFCEIRVLVHTLGGIDDKGMLIVEYEDGKLGKARYDRITFTDSLHDTYDFE